MAIGGTGTGRNGAGDGMCLRVWESYRLVKSRTRSKRWDAGGFRSWIPHVGPRDGPLAERNRANELAFAQPTYE